MSDTTAGRPAGEPATASGPIGEPADPESYLATRVLDAVLRENYGRLAEQVVRPPASAPPSDHPVADSSLSGHPPAACLPLSGGRHVRLRQWRGPYAPGFLADLTVAPGQQLRLGEVLDTVAHVADPRDDVPAFARECHEALTALRLHIDSREAVFARLIRLRRTRSPLTASTWYDTLAARIDHPVYPTARCRLGLTAEELRRYGPEFHPSFRLRWAAVPRRAVTAAGRLPAWWPGPAEVGLPAELADTHVLLPVHPLTAERGLPAAEADHARGMIDAESGAPATASAPGAVLIAPHARVTVAPTLSMRTVAVDATTHVKLPLPTSTLGRRNRRSLVPGTLADGALVQRILAAVRAAEPDLPVFLADESTYGHAGHPELGYLVRRFPPELAGATTVPVAALLAPAPGGSYVIEELTSDIGALFAAYLDALFEWNVTLFVRYGIALEAHQQNLSLVVREHDATPALLIKDNDGAMIDLARLRGLPPAEVSADRFADQRILTNDAEQLVRVFVTITVHLCAGALAFGLAERGLLPLRSALATVRERLAAALARWGADPMAAFLRARTLDAARLPTKAMVTAGTLVDKERTGCRDVNKHYGPPGPNYLLPLPIPHPLAGSRSASLAGSPLGPAARVLRPRPESDS